MKFTEDQEFIYILAKDEASIFGNDEAEIEWNVTDDGKVIITQFINNEYHTPIMDHNHFIFHERPLYEKIVEHIKYTFIDNAE